MNIPIKLLNEIHFFFLDITYTMAIWVMKTSSVGKKLEIFCQVAGKNPILKDLESLFKFIVPKKIQERLDYCVFSVEIIF